VESAGGVSPTPSTKLQAVGEEPGGGGTLNTAKKALLDQASRPSFTPSEGYTGGFARSKVAWILSDTPGDILPHMKRSFVDRQYSPSTDMDMSEWEIILKQLITMGYIVREELVSKTDD
jgi:hypothetical protein